MGQTHKHTDSQTDGHTDTQTHRHTDRQGPHPPRPPAGAPEGGGAAPFWGRPTLHSNHSALAERQSKARTGGMGGGASAVRAPGALQRLSSVNSSPGGGR